VLPLALQIRLATVADARRIAELSRDAIEHGLPWRWTPARVLRCLADRTVNVVVAHDSSVSGSVPAGFAIMKYRDDDAHLWLLAVAPTARRRGVGTALLGWLEATARVAGTPLVWLEARRSNSAALAFYQHLGYRELDVLPQRYEGLEDGVRLGKDLALG
jgi:ribosomal-protein-alanine N-acetyltransferase